MKDKRNENPSSKQKRRFKCQECASVFVYGRAFVIFVVAVVLVGVVSLTSCIDKAAELLPTSK